MLFSLMFMVQEYCIQRSDGVANVRKLLLHFSVFKFFYLGVRRKHTQQYTGITSGGAWGIIRDAEDLTWIGHVQANALPLLLFPAPTSVFIPIVCPANPYTQKCWN